MQDNDITALDGCALSQAIHRRDVSVREVMQPTRAGLPLGRQRIGSPLGELLARRRAIA